MKNSIVRLAYKCQYGIFTPYDGRLDYVKSGGPYDVVVLYGIGDSNKSYTPIQEYPLEYCSGDPFGDRSPIRNKFGKRQLFLWSDRYNYPREFGAGHVLYYDRGQLYSFSDIEVLLFWAYYSKVGPLNDTDIERYLKAARLKVNLFNMDKVLSSYYVQVSDFYRTKVGDDDRYTVWEEYGYSIKVTDPYVLSLLPCKRRIIWSEKGYGGIELYPRDKLGPQERKRELLVNTFKKKYNRLEHVQCLFNYAIKEHELKMEEQAKLRITCAKYWPIDRIGKQLPYARRDDFVDLLNVLLTFN